MFYCESSGLIIFIYSNTGRDVCMSLRVCHTFILKGKERVYFGYFKWKKNVKKAGKHDKEEERSKKRVF